MDVSFSLPSTKLAFYKTRVFSSLPHKKLSCLLKLAFANKDRKDKEILFPFLNFINFLRKSTTTFDKVQKFQRSHFSVTFSTLRLL